MRTRLRHRTGIRLRMQGGNQVAGGLVTIAQSFERLQLFFQGAQFFEALAHMLQVRRNGVRGGVAIGGVVPIERQKRTHFIE